MPNIKSAKKRMRQNEKVRLENRTKKAAVRTQEKKLRKQVSENNLVEAAKTLQQFSSLIDKAAKKNIYHKNTASRKISRLSMLLKKSAATATQQ